MASPVTRSRPSAAGPRTRWIAATDAMLGKCMDGNPMAVTRETATEGTDDVVLGRGGQCADCGWPFRASAVRNAMKPSNVTRHSDNNGEIRFRNLEPFASLRGAKRYRRGGF
ncbi:hypothetical protein E4U47_007360 [Claviceps purpurea]|nr:hypothetical protein E4U47_007360 [Claviceps purpurea]